MWILPKRVASFSKSFAKAIFVFLLSMSFSLNYISPAKTLCITQEGEVEVFFSQECQKHKIPVIEKENSFCQDITIWHNINTKDQKPVLVKRQEKRFEILAEIFESQIKEKEVFSAEQKMSFIFSVFLLI